MPGVPVCLQLIIGYGKEISAKILRLKPSDHTAPLSVLKESGPALKTSLRHIFESDSRPDLVFPDSGYLWKISQEMASITPGSQTGICDNRGDVPSGATNGQIDRALQLKLEGLLQKPFRLCDWLVGEVTFSSGLVHSLTRHSVSIFLMCL
ncbi:unnamed protein product [Trichobilharzia regenti]|nr:unnamed protein product [Trichobilharzia regenti]